MGERRLTPAARRWLIGVATAAMVLAAAYASTFSWLFAADVVRVEGASRLTEDEVRRLAGLGPGTNVFHLDEGRAVDRLRADPWIAEATVVGDLPDAISVRVVERIPVATIDLDGETAVVAGDGVLLPGAHGGALPEIRSVAGELDETRRVDAARALAAFAPGLRRSVATVFSGPGGELVMETEAGVSVTYGAVVDVGAKGAALRAVLEWAEEQGIDLIAVDVTVPAAPTARTQQGSVTPT